MSPLPQHRARGFRFSLRTLLLVITGVALVLTPYAIWQKEEARIEIWGQVFRKPRHFLFWDPSLAPEDQFSRSGAQQPVTTVVYRKGFSPFGSPWGYIYSVRLVGPGADDTDLAALAKCPELLYLELIDTNVTGEAVARLQRAVPNCVVVR